ncbi:MAG: tRNA pseudouridine synthase [Chloroflexi bacterium]|jgi:tRNA pseudouridine55 synthase|nr:tRNA pseudouridine synthase [Chloroflexota bacterium]
MVARVRRILREKRVGHAGTLDPAAEGVLPVCVGQATRVVEYLSDAHKVYCALLGLGLTTDTYDREGVVTAKKPVPDFTPEALEVVLARFRGKIGQLPPVYSAIKIAGQPLYKAARAGTTAGLDLQPRPVEIFKLEITEWHSPWLKLWVECSKGTYIRSLAYDIGESLGCGAFMAGLVRVQSGPFHLSQAHRLEEVEAAYQAGRLELDILQPLDAVLADWPAWVVDQATAEKIRQGRNLAPAGPEWLLNAQFDATAGALPLRRVYTDQGQLLALMEQQGQEWHPVKVFNF